MKDLFRLLPLILTGGACMMPMLSLIYGEYDCLYYVYDIVALSVVLTMLLKNYKHIKRKVAIALGMNACCIFLAILLLIWVDYSLSTAFVG